MADDQAAMGRRFASAIAAVGVLTAGGLLMAAGPAQAESAMSSQARLTPNPGEWWLADWQVGQKVWPLTQGAGVTVAVLDTGVQASLPDLRGVVRPGGDMTGGGSRGETDIAARGDGHGTAVAVLIAGQGSGTGTVGIAPRATPRGRAVAATTPARSPGGPVMTLEDIVITGVAAVCVFVAVLVFVLRMSSPRRSGPSKPYGLRMLRDRRLVATTAPTHARGPGEWEEKAWSFGPQEDEEYGGGLGYGRPPGYGPPPLWTEEPYDPPGWR